MPANVAGLRYPHERVLLPRTRLAYVHLRNLLTDAKRDRAARVFGYVAIWLPEEFLVLYLQEGELVNSTSYDGHTHRPLPIAEALDKVPAEPEYGEVCFHEADDEQLACMYGAQILESEPWPDELNVADPAALFPYLMATTFDGTVELALDGCMNYLIFRDGAVERAFLSVPHQGTLVERVRGLFAEGRSSGKLGLRRWPVPPPLPVQPSPKLIQAYRDLMTQLVQRLVQDGHESAPTVAEYARQTLLPQHPSLESFSVSGRAVRDPVADAAGLTRDVTAWISEIIWAAVDPSVLPPEILLRELTWERRHMLQSAGFYDGLPWAVDR